MQTIIPLQNIRPEDLPRVGGKAVSLANLMRGGFRVPDGLCVTASAYEAFIAGAGLRERILLELNRKDARHLRWEEVWDSALRIRGMFLNHPLPEAMREELTRHIEPRFGDAPVVVRSSAPAEDSEKTSFAGLHESYVNVVGTEAILEHIRRVWASLWSDAAILYRRELNLDAAVSSMAVVIQEIVPGECAGVAFSRSPMDPAQAVIEAVHGLNQGLVDGVIEPDRWILDRDDGTVLSHVPARREQYMVPGKTGVRALALPRELAEVPPLNDHAVRRVFQIARQAETLYTVPQDVEWTLRRGELFVLQSRPVTTGSTPSPQDDRRQWDLSLRRSFENLRALRPQVESGIREMIAEADRLAAVHLSEMTDEALNREMARRSEILKRWTDIYWADFIPFAHGIRLFGQVYNDAVHPEDPYEFVALLQGSRMQGLERNRMLAEMAAAVRSRPSLKKQLEAGDLDSIDGDLKDMLQNFVQRFGSLGRNSFRGTSSGREQRTLITVLLRMAIHPPAAPKAPEKSVAALKSRFLAAFDTEEDRRRAAEIMELGRVSYQLRDDDNIYLGRIEEAQIQAAAEARRRLTARGRPVDDALPAESVRKALQDPGFVPPKPASNGPPETMSGFTLKSRQIVGQPAGPGVAAGPARVVRNTADLAEFRKGEILVCDAIDPTMTFIVPLAAGIVERRGGMLIHGAIIAREYGLPCVTGAPDVTALIATGDRVTVDGYLGIVTRG